MPAPLGQTHKHPFAIVLRERTKKCDQTVHSIHLMARLLVLMTVLNECLCRSFVPLCKSQDQDTRVVVNTTSSRRISDSHILSKLVTPSTEIPSNPETERWSLQIVFFFSQFQ